MGQGDGHPRDCRRVIPDARSGRWGHPGDSGHVTIDAEFGKEITLETGHGMTGTVPGSGHPGDYRLLTHVHSLLVTPLPDPVPGEKVCSLQGDHSQALFLSSHVQSLG